MSSDPHASRRLEVAQLELAIEKTIARCIEADEQARCLRDKLASQLAEYRFQKMILRTPYAAAGGKD